jgi:hypothetical protein
MKEQFPMTESTSTTPNPLQAASSPLTFGAANYFAVLRSQLEMTAQLTTAWASAMSALSSRMVAQSPTLAPLAGDGDQTSRGVWSNGFPGLRAVRNVGSDDSSSTEEQSGDRTWDRPVFGRPATGGMLRWLTEPPTLQSNLFDETIELLLDEDIKTAS